MTTCRRTCAGKARGPCSTGWGVAIGGSHHQTVDIAASALAPFSGPQQASLLGRPERFLERKFSDLAEGILPKQQTAKLMELCWKVEGLSDAGEIARMGSRPSA